MPDLFKEDLLGSPAERAVWADLEGLRHGDTVRGSRRLVADLAARRARRRQWLRRWRPAVPAAAMAMAAAAAVVMVRPAPGVQTLETRVGEMRRETLADGTVVLLNTDSRLRVAFGERSREVTLLDGQARFDVAHDTSRPFRVRAGALSVTAVGTAFDVVALPSRTAVTLIQGKVLVRTADRPGGKAAPPAFLAPGEQITIAAGRVTPPHRARLDAALAWQHAYVDLDNLTLRQALDEVNRYSTTKIAVEATGLDHEQLGGVFRAGDVDAVTRAICAYFDLQVVRREPGLVVLGRAAG